MIINHLLCPFTLSLLGIQREVLAPKVLKFSKVVSHGDWLRLASLFFYTAFYFSLPTGVFGLPWWFSGKEPAWQCRRHQLEHWVRKIPWRRKWQPTSYFCLGNPMDRTLAGCSPWGHKNVRHDLGLNNSNKGILYYQSMLTRALVFEL